MPGVPIITSSCSVLETIKHEAIADTYRKARLRALLHVQNMKTFYNERYQLKDLPVSVKLCFVQEYKTIN